MYAFEKMKKARAGLLLDAPFFGSLALRLRMVENTEKRIYTDGTVLSYDPAIVDPFTLDETKGVIAHEVMHLAMSHHTRANSRDHGTWNKAGDYAINGILRENRFTLPDGVLYDPAYKGQAAEAIYNTLYARPEPEPEQGGGNKPGENGQQQTGTGQGQGDTPGQQNQPGNGTGQPQERKPGDSPNWGDVEPAKDPQGQESDWKIAVQSAAQAQKSRGELTGELARMIKELLNPRVPWEILLRDFIDRTARNDYNWSRINTRYLHTGFLFPSLISDELPGIIVAIDTSGSVSDAELAQAKPEIQSILDTYKTTVNILYCDSRIKGEQEFSTGDTVKLEPMGGGGTDFKPVFDRITEQETAPACLIYLTDLYGHFPDTEPEYPVLWINTDKDGGRMEPPFGEHIKIY